MTVVLRSFPALALALLLTGCPMLQDRLMFFPTRVATGDVARLARGVDERIARAADWTVGGEWWGLVAEPAAGEPRATALVFHGNAGWAGDRTYYLGPLVRRGWRVVLVEYPGYGPRPGEPGIESALIATGRAIAVALETWPGPLILLGESLGAALVARHAKGHEARLAGLVLVTPWDNLRSVATRHYPGLLVRLALRDPLDNVAALKGFAKPVAVLVAGRDEIVGAEGGRALAASLGATLVELPEAGHNDWLGSLTGREWDALLDPEFLNR